VAAVLADAGFEATTLEDCALRIQAGEPTPGMIVTARRSEAR
jgi:predicted TPR repeat methyltransferase